MAGFAQVAVLRQGGADSDSASARPGRRAVAAAGGPPAVRVRRRVPAVGPGALPQLAGGWAGQLAGQLSGRPSV